MKPSRQSQAARRRAAAAAAIASVGAGILGTQSAEAGIVTINLAAAGSPGVNITGVNGGVASGNFKLVNNFPISGGGNLYVANGSSSGGSTYLGLQFGGGGAIAADNGMVAKPHNFAAGTPIGYGLGLFFTDYTYFTVFKKTGSYGGTSPSFGAGSYLGFVTSQANFGWIRATWDGTDFRLYTAAYESVAGTSILAGAGDTTAVPEIDPSGLASTMSLVMGSVAMLEQRRRKRAVAAESAAVTA